MFIGNQHAIRILQTFYDCNLVYILYLSYFLFKREFRPSRSLLDSQLVGLPFLSLLHFSSEEVIQDYPHSDQANAQIFDTNKSGISLSRSKPTYIR
jgi:hypothetical protein